MTIYLIERNFPQELEITPEIAGAVAAANDSAGVKWLYSLLTADGRKTYCVYEGDSPEAVLTAAKTAGIPADVVVEVIDIEPENLG